MTAYYSRDYILAGVNSRVDKPPVANGVFVNKMKGHEK